MKYSEVPMGYEFYYLTVSSPPIYKRCKGNRIRTYYLCSCKCGKKIQIIAQSLLNGRSKSCGCYKSEIKSKQFAKMNTVHGLYHSRLYRIWNSMHNRCYCKTNNKYNSYGGRGIYICEEWKTNFLAFYNWAMSNGYEDKFSIDRINNNGHYSPDNCRWTDMKTQANNTRRTIYLTAFGETKSLNEWTKDNRCKTTRCAIYQRVRRGMDHESAISSPSFIA